MDADEKGNVKREEKDKELSIEELLRQLLNKEREKKKELVDYT